MTERKRIGRREYITVALVSVVLGGSLALMIRPFDPDKQCCDHLAYRSMSYNLFSMTRPDLNVPPPGNKAFDMPAIARFQLRYGLDRLPPYVYRVVTPLLARGIAFMTDIDTAYYLISLISLLGAAVFIGWSILELNQFLLPALAGTIVFFLNPFTLHFNLRDYMLTDPMAFLLASLAIWALFRRNRALFFVTCAVGVLNKESMVPMVVVYPLSELWLDGHARRSSVLLSLLIGIGWYVFRLAMPEANTGYSMLTEFRGGWNQVRLMLIAGMLTLGVLLPGAVRRGRTSRLILSLAPFALGAVLSAWFVDDLQRAMVQAWPVLCVALFWSWPATRRERILALAVVPLAGLSTMFYLLDLPDWFERTQLSSARAIGLLGLAATGVELWLWQIDRRSSSHRIRDLDMASRIASVKSE